MQKTTVALLALLTSGHALAETATKGGFMIGANVTMDSSNYAEEVEDLLGSGFNAKDDGANPGADIYIGYAFGAASSIRLGHRQFGEQRGDVLFNGFTAVEYSVDAGGVYLATDLMLPVGERFALGATLGLQNWDGEVTAKSSMGTEKEDSDGRDFFYGLRGKFLFNEGKGGIVAGYTRYSFEDESDTELEYDSFSLGLEGYFR